MPLYINRILNDEHLTSILNYIFIDRPVSIIRTISRTGRNKSSVPWVYYVNEITGQKFSTFISFQDLLENFWVWLESVNLFAIAFFQRQKISEVVWHFVKVGDHVFSLQHGWGTIIEKQILDASRQRRLWIDLESDSQIEIIEPCMVEIF